MKKQKFPTWSVIIATWMTMIEITTYHVAIFRFHCILLISRKRSAKTRPSRKNGDKPVWREADTWVPGPHIKGFLSREVWWCSTSQYIPPLVEVSTRKQQIKPHRERFFFTQCRVFFSNATLLHTMCCGSRLNRKDSFHRNIYFCTVHVFFSHKRANG